MVANLSSQRHRNVCITLVRKLQSSPEAVFAAWTEPRLIAQWLAPGADQVTAVTADLRRGGHYRIDAVHGDGGGAYSITGTYLELVENSRVAISWIYDGPVSALKIGASVVSADLRRIDSETTELVLSHEKLDERDAAELYRLNWRQCVDKLETVSGSELKTDQLRTEGPLREFYTEEHRRFQDQFETRKLADRLQALTVREDLDVVDAAFITRQNMFFLATTDANGEPSCSYKGGARGFVTIVDKKTIAFPDFDGNGMHISVGNISETGRVALLFVDFERQARLRIKGRASVSADDRLLRRYPGARLIVRVSIDAVFANCPRYIHKMVLEEESSFVPDGENPQPPAAWKRLFGVSDVLPGRDEEEIGLETDYDKAMNRG